MEREWTAQYTTQCRSRKSTFQDGRSRGHASDIVCTAQTHGYSKHMGTPLTLLKPRERWYL